MTGPFRTAEDYELFLYHKHIPPDIKHHRISTPELSFTQPNLPALIGEIERLIEQIEREAESH